MYSEALFDLSAMSETPLRTSGLEKSGIHGLISPRYSATAYVSNLMACDRSIKAKELKVCMTDWLFLK